MKLQVSEVRDTLLAFIGDNAFPCVGAKAAINSDSYVLFVYSDLGSAESSSALARDLEQFAQSELCRANEYATFVAVFEGPKGIDEEAFERLLWAELQQLTQIDPKCWAEAVSADPVHPLFSFSFAEVALYVVGMHPNSSRKSRRFPLPALIFNPHAQFERLRSEGKWPRMQETIRVRDAALQGSINPMLGDFGERSEARQYSGRVTDDQWQPPFKASGATVHARCPFHHRACWQIIPNRKQAQLCRQTGTMAH